MLCHENLSKFTSPQLISKLKIIDTKLGLIFFDFIRLYLSWRFGFDERDFWSILYNSWDIDFGRTILILSLFGLIQKYHGEKVIIRLNWCSEVLFLLFFERFIPIYLFSVGLFLPVIVLYIIFRLNFRQTHVLFFICWYDILVAFIFVLKITETKDKTFLFFFIFLMRAHRFSKLL